MLRSVKYGLYGTVIAGLVAGTVAWTGVDKDVTLVVDGQTSHVHTTAAKVGGVLSDAGYHPGSHDIVAPAVNSSVHSGETVVYKRARLLALTVDGRTKLVWTTATDVSQALAALGYSSQDAVSVSRAARLSLNPTALVITTLKHITVVREGKTSTVSTTADSVAALLKQLNVSAANSWTSAPMSSALTPGMTLVIKATRKATETVTVALPYATTSVNDATLPKGVTQVKTAGQEGTATITYSVLYVDGKVSSKTQIKKVVTRQPVTQVMAVGTANPGPVDTPAGAQAYAASILSNYGWGQDQMSCLITLWDHESGWRYNAENASSGAYGIPQALPGSKMGPGWQTDARVQIRWGLGYIQSRYSTPCGAWAFWQQGSWY